MSNFKQLRECPDELFISLHKESAGIHSLCNKLIDLKYNAYWINTNMRVKRLQLDCSHFIPYKKTSRISQKLTLENIFNNKVRISSRVIRLKLIKSGIKDYKCECCSLSEWQNSEIPLQLDHINGNRFDNRLENLRILCANCHSQTETFNTQKYATTTKKFNCCIDCGVYLSHSKVRRCYRCNPIYKQIIKWPSKEEFDKLLKFTNYNFSEIGRRLGVSCSAIRKHYKTNKGLLKKEIKNENL